MRFKPLCIHCGCEPCEIRYFTLDYPLPSESPSQSLDLRAFASLFDKSTKTSGLKIHNHVLYHHPSTPGRVLVEVDIADAPKDSEEIRTKLSVAVGPVLERIYPVCCSTNDCVSAAELVRYKIRQMAKRARASRRKAERERERETETETETGMVLVKEAGWCLRGSLLDKFFLLEGAVIFE
ncbi:hypothetical protein BJX61DRAFT_545297 [Aspergillus egyptiacus]|nr:hypothetical protein BJX61DRAFT_545297 [Aspergillus egyptiacus]